jgi:uncharacterized protein YutE (UPF0331/DUF86 family)
VVLKPEAVRSRLLKLTRERLKGLGGFRNILVHDYLRLDPDLVATKLTRAP